MKVSVVIPAFNEEHGIGPTLDSIPVQILLDAGYEVEKLVVDNASTDNTAEVAKRHGARVIYQPKRGYGNAYQMGFSHATGDIVASGDADMTYPFDQLPRLLSKMKSEDIDFMNTNRLMRLRRGIMSPSHIFGNYLLSLIMHMLFNAPFQDSQSGMWIFKRSIWPYLNAESAGMPFSQEIKIEAYTKGFRCKELSIDYRKRIGHEKLSLLDAWRTMFELFKKRLTIRKTHFDWTAEELE